MKIFIKRSSLFVIAFAFLFMVACINSNDGIGGDNVNEVEALEEISEEDFNTIDYVNKNSHLGVEFMKKLGDDVRVEAEATQFESGYYEQSVDGLVEGVGFYIPELQGNYLSSVVINNNDKESDVLGVKNGDKYGEAVKKLEEQGFALYLNDVTFKKVICRKGRTVVEFYYNQDKKEELNDYSIRNVGVRFMFSLPETNENIEYDI